MYEGLWIPFSLPDLAHHLVCWPSNDFCLILHSIVTFVILKFEVEVLMGVPEYYSCVIYFLCGMERGGLHGLPRFCVSFSFPIFIFLKKQHFHMVYFYLFGEYLPST